MICHGTGEDHCCMIAGEICEFLEEGTVEGRRWACGLLRQLGSWPAVYADARYQQSAAAALFVGAWAGYGCGDWPQNIPDAIGSLSGKCCWQVADRSEVIG